jgi:hypothetical protein
VPPVPVPDPPLDAADDAGAAPIGDRRRPRPLAELENGLDLRFVTRGGDEVGWIGELAPEAAHDVAVRLAERVADPVVTVVAEDRRDRVGRSQPGGRELDIVERHRILDLAPEPEPLANPLRRLLQLPPRGLLVLEPPAPVLAAAGGGAYQ